MWLDTRHRQKISTENIICPNALSNALDRQKHLTIILGYDNDLRYVVRQTYDKAKMLLITTKIYDNLMQQLTMKLMTN